MSEEQRDSAHSESDADDDRRRGGRVPTRRPVLYTSRDHEDPAREGLAADMSSGGLCIHTRYPYPLGTPLDIEVEPERSGSGDPVFMQGSVMHTTEIGQGEFAMGVRIRHKKPTLPPTSGGAGGPRSPYLKRLMGRSKPRSLQAPGASPLSGQQPAAQATASNTRGRRWWLALPLLLLLGLLLPKPNFSDGAPSGSARGALPGADGPVIEQRADPGSGVSRGTAVAATRAVEPEVPEPPAGVYGLLTADEPVGLVGDVIARLADAESLMQAGETTEARNTINDAMKLVSAVAPVWRDEVRAMMQASRGGLAAIGDMESFSDEVDLELLAPAAEPAEGETAPLLIEINRSAYTLEVFEEGESVAVFPVGLGRSGSTPTGNFRIVDKLVNPDWYNRGEVVPAGSPDNPLGSRWMGLGKRGKGTGYGIHGTEDPASIGQPKSRGCVRMRPGDVEALFNLCPLGTPVRIVS